MSETSEPPRLRIVYLLAFTSLFLLGLTRCGSSNKYTSAPNAPITVPRGPEIVVDAGKNVPIRANAKGADSYKWELEGEGNISDTTGEAILYAPPNNEGTARLSVIASNQY